MKNLSIAITALIVLIGCIPPRSTPINTEVIVEDGDVKWGRDQIAQNYIQRGFSVRETSDYGITVSKKLTDDNLATLLYGSRMDTDPELRVQFRMFMDKEGLHILPSAVMVTNPGTGFEHISQLGDRTKYAREAYDIIRSLIN